MILYLLSMNNHGSDVYLDFWPLLAGGLYYTNKASY